MTGKDEDELRERPVTEGRGTATKLGQPPESRVHHVIAVMSGKGGVGKSTVSVLLACEIAREGYRVGILDADITGPSVPKLLGVRGRPAVLGSWLLPEKGPLGIAVMSIGFFLERQDDPVVWRGPLIAGAIKQFWTEVVWGDLDYLIVDLPPGTGDAPLTVLQSLPVEAVIVVTTPQSLALEIVKKAVTMALLLGVRVLGYVENMAYVVCPECGNRINLFGAGGTPQASSYLGVPLLGSLPVDPRLSSLGDSGKTYEYRAAFLFDAVKGMDKKSNEDAGGWE